ncbi:MAG: UvrD-helicase domain-containing protein [Eggerthellales bacterium]|nr:UvrD-helicase domain-containing protein [Eggerthellales bacterium]
MNLDRCTPFQREIVTTLDKPLMVAAGAGSGKTFTLTQRIAAALLPGPDGSPAALESVDQVLAITFTRKAAAELKSRIKSLLLKEGLAQEALKVDDAWISTIHGMCSRILKEHALEIGVDPAFELLSDIDADDLWGLAAEAAFELARNGDLGYPAQRLVDETPLYSKGRSNTGVLDQASVLMSRVETMPGGFDALVCAHPTKSPKVLLMDLYQKGREFSSIAADWSKPTATDEKHQLALDQALEKTRLYMELEGQDDFAGEDFDAVTYLDAVFSYPKVARNYKASSVYGSFFQEYLCTYAQVAAEAGACCAYVRQEGLVAFARAFKDILVQLKGPDRVDQNDLLVMTYQALRAHPEIARSYQDKFKLIMVDEFQDTDKLQCDIISRLAAPDGSNICTVGDAQQSIYRFRGADVNVFFDFRDQMCQTNPQTRLIELPDNFRSHAHVLQLVDRIFAMPQVFGSRFLHLEPKGDVNKESDPVFDEMPRIVFDVVGTPVRGGSMEAARGCAAQGIAERFAALRNKGVKPGDMVVLLGAMSHADMYARALQEQGFESLIVGGSVFGKQPEVQTLAYLGRWIANPYDDEALYQVLASEIFNCSDDALLALGGKTRLKDDEAPKRRGLARTLVATWGEGIGEMTQAQRDDLLFTCRVLKDSLSCARSQGLTSALHYVCVESGWMLRLERGGTDGLFKAGNVLKALRYVEELEADGAGLAQASKRFARMLVLSKDRPGALSTPTSDYVRIMTVHASKGLEFPHVAISELRLGDVGSMSLYAENVGETCLFACEAPLKREQRERRNDLIQIASELEEHEPTFNQQSPAEFLAALKARTEEQERQEAQRLLYVALTRASRSLYVALPHKLTKKGYEGMGVLGDMHNALKWDISCEAHQMVDFGACAPALVKTREVRKEDWVPQEPEKQEDFLIPSTPQPPETHWPRVRLTGRMRQREGVVSYTTLPHEDLPGFAWKDDPCSYADMRRRSKKNRDAANALDDMERSEGNPATDLGSAFHLLAQEAIERAAAAEASHLIRPSDERVSSLVRECMFDSLQTASLRSALDRWFSSQCAARFAAHDCLQAEVPFFLPVSCGTGEFFLEGEIDGLAFDGPEVAYLIDYKTGGNAGEGQERLRLKHGLQARCYALALIREGFSQVRSTFVRVEQSDPAHPGEPETVEFVFNASDAPAIEEEIVRLWKSVEVNGGPHEEVFEEVV